MPVLGMGGYFFRARDPEKLKAWYRDHLGVGGGCGADERGQSDDWLWHYQSGPMVFEPFKTDTDYFPAEKTAMINLRVENLDDLLRDLRASGIEVTQESSMDEIGRFARVHDPEGNPIELWEPVPTREG